MIRSQRCIAVALVLFGCGALVGQNQELPATPAGELLGRFLHAVETGEIEPFVNTAFDEAVLQRIPAEEHVRFLRMMHRMHGGFTVYEVVRSEPHRIEVVCQSKRRKVWRRFLLECGDSLPPKITGIGIEDSPPPEAYLQSLPKITIERPANDDAIVRGARAQKIDAYLTRLESVGYSGGALIADSTGVILAKGYGYADREQRRVFNRRTVFTIGSITKSFTGAAAVKLASLGKISFDDPIAQYFPDVPPDKQAITLHHLLTHTAGFPGAIGDDFERIPRDAFIAQAMQTQLVSPPGAQYHYSNVGYSLMAAIIELVTGQSYERFLREHVLLPAGMERTGYVLPAWDEADIVVGYAGQERWGKPTELMWGEDGPGWHLQGNGGLLSTLDDLYRWGRAILGEHVFTAAEKQTYLTPYVPEGPQAESDYAYGWVRMKSSRGTEVITHNGGNPYIQNDLYLYPQEGVIVYLTSNNGAFSALDFSGRVLQMLFAEE